MAKVTELLLKNVMVLGLRDPVTEIVDVIRQNLAVDVVDPVADERYRELMDIPRRDNLSAAAVCLARGGISNPNLCKDRQFRPLRSSAVPRDDLLSRDTVMAAIDGCSVMPGGCDTSAPMMSVGVLK